MASSLGLGFRVEHVVAFCRLSWHRMHSHIAFLLGADCGDMFQK